MRGLIVTADDFGYDPERNRGIHEAWEDGIVTAVSMLANGRAFEHACELLLRAPKLFVGLHLNLSEGKPLTRGLRTLTGAGGEFLGKGDTRAALKKGLVDRREIQEECAAQIRRLVERGVPLTHLDGHQHIHLWPMVRDAVAEVCREFGVRTVRIPQEPVPPAGSVPEERREQIRRYASLCRQARIVYRHYGVLGPAHFRGLALVGRWTREAFVQTLEEAPDGWTEVMTHPGYANPAAGPFSSAEREAELRTLTDPALKVRVEDRFELGTYRKALK